VEEEWSRFKGVVLRGAKEVCGTKMRRLGNWSKRSEWWSEEIGEMVKRKKVAFKEFIENRNGERWENYKEKCREVKRCVKAGKRRAKERWGNRVEEYARTSNKMFWREVNRVRVKKEKVRWGIKDREGRVVMGREEEGAVWGRYFKSLLNEGSEERAVVEGEWEEELRGVENVEEGSGRITMIEVEETIKKLKKGKAAGRDGIMGEMIRAGGVAMCRWLARMMNVCWERGEVPKDWQEACVVPVYKGCGNKNECGSYRGISMMSVVGKLYGRVVIERIKNITEGLVGEEQVGF